MYLVRMIPALAILLATSSAAAQSSPSPVDIDVPLVIQDTDDWCWLAAAEMVSLYRAGQSQMQCEMAEELDQFAPSWCCGDTERCSRPSNGLTETAEVLATAGVQTRPSMALTSTVLYSYLMTDMPVVAQVRNSEGTTHAMVIRGMYYRGLTPVLVVNDPMHTQPRYMYYRDFAVGWVNSLIVER